MFHLHPHDRHDDDDDVVDIRLRLSEAQEKMRQHRRRAMSKAGSGRNGEISKEEMEKQSNLKCLKHFTHSRFWRSQGKTLEHLELFICS